MKSIYTLLNTAVIFGFACLSANVASCAEAFNYSVTFTQTKDEGPLQDRQLYAIDIKCTPRGPATPTDANLYTVHLLARTYYAASHIVLVTQKPVTDSPSLTSLPTDALMLVHPYTTAKGSGFRDGDCEQTQVVLGGAPLHIVSAATFSTSNEVDPIVKVFESALNVVAPLATIIGGGGAAGVVEFLTKTGSDVNSVAAPYQTLLTALNQSQVSAQSHTLRAGTYKITAPFSQETVTVRPIVSLLQDRLYPFRKYLRDQLATVTTTLPTTDIRTTCQKLDTAFSDSGLHAPVDRGYALLQLNLKAGFQKQQILQCMTTREEALAVARLGDAFWDNANPTTQRFTVPDVDIVLPPPSDVGVTPSYDAAMVQRLYRLVTTLSQVGRKGSAADSDKAKLAALFSPPVSISDYTFDELLGGDESASVDDLTKVFLAKGLNRFGCFTPNTATGLDAIGDGAIASFLGFVVPKDAVSASPGDAVLFRPFFDKSGINKLAASRDVGMIFTILNAAGKQCGELMIKPAAP